MKHYLLYIFAATLLASCSTSYDEPSGEISQSKVRFAASVPVKEDDWSSATRGSVTDNANISSFGAFCFNTARTPWATAAATALPNKMFDVEVLRTPSTSDWAYNPPVEWLGGDGSLFTFFGYSPRAAGIYQEPDNPNGNNIELTSTVSTPGVPTLSYTTIDYVPMQVDLLVAKPVYDTRPVDKVQMQFTHALSQIRFRAWAAQDFVRVTSIEISKVKYKATLTLDGSTLTPEAEVKTFLLDNINRSLSTDKNKPTDLSDGINAFMLLPQDLTGNVTAQITVTYEVGGETKTSTPYTIIQNWEANKSYTYLLNLGGTPTEEMVVTGVTMTDWIVDSEEDMSTTPTPPPTESYIPTNVLQTAGWPADKLPATGLQVAMRGDKQMPVTGTPGTDPANAWKTDNTTTTNVESVGDLVSAKFGMGKANTDAMVATPELAVLHPAAQYCRDMGPEWYLPSSKELDLIFKNKNLLGSSYSFSTSDYWSSTQNNSFANYAYYISFSNGGMERFTKSASLNVRCVREI